MDAFYIKNIEIKGMFENEHIFWEVSPKVNILGGENGSGKSTILKSVYALIKDRYIKDAKLVKLSQWICITFINGYRLTWDKLLYQSTEYQREEGFFYHLNTNLVDSEGFLILQRCKLTDAENNIQNTELLTEQIKGFLINSFEQRIMGSAEKDEKIQNRTYLDQLIYEQLFIRNSRFAGVFEELISTAMNKNIQVKTLVKQTEIKAFLQFYETLKHFLKGYKVHINNNMLFSRKGSNRVLTYTDLSMGEKQLLLLLLMVSNTVNDRCIFFMDEPDLGMHVEWKEVLLKELHTLNPNMQLIVSTHAPSLVEGWYDYVKEVKQLMID